MKTILALIATLSLLAANAFADTYTEVSVTGPKAKALIQALALGALVPARHDDNTVFRNYIVADLHCHGSTEGPYDDQIARRTCELHVKKGDTKDMLAGNAAASVLFGNLLDDLGASVGTGMSHVEARLQNVRCRVNLAVSAPATYVCAFQQWSE